MTKSAFTVNSLYPHPLPESLISGVATAVTFRKGVTPWLPFRRPASRLAALVH